MKYSDPASFKSGFAVPPGLFGDLLDQLWIDRVLGRLEHCCGWAWCYGSTTNNVAKSRCAGSRATCKRLPPHARQPLELSGLCRRSLDRCRLVREHGVTMTRARKAKRWQVL